MSAWTFCIRTSIAYCLLFRIFVQNITMAIPSFFKQTKPRGFNYAPRHYDPVKEEREARHRAMGMDKESREPGTQDTGLNGKSREQKAGSMGKEMETAGQKPYKRTITKGSMRDIYHHSQGRTRQLNSIRLIVIILILVLVTYLYLRF